MSLCVGSSQIGSATGEVLEIISAVITTIAEVSILRPSNSIGRVRIRILEDIAITLNLNLDEPSTINPKTLVMQRQIVVTDHTTRIHEIPRAKETKEAALYLVSNPSGVPCSIAKLKNKGIANSQTHRIESGTIVVERISIEVNQFLSLG